MKAQTPLSPVMTQIEKLALELSTARDEMASLLATREEQIRSIDKQCMPRIRVLIRMTADRTQAIRDLIEANRGEFSQPKSRTLHGVKCGLRAGGGKMTFEDEARTVHLIEKLYTEKEAETLLHIIKRPNKEALETLEAKELKKLGVEIIGTDDVVFVKAVDSDLDQIVKALLAVAMTTDEESQENRRAA